MRDEEKDTTPATMTDVLDERTEIFQECSNCETLFRFPVTKRQVLRYLPPRTDPVQDIFPELPAEARVVLSQGNVCALCLPQIGGDAREILKPFIVGDEEVTA